MQKIFKLTLFAVLFATIQVKFVQARPDCNPEIALTIEEGRLASTRDPGIRGRKNCAPVGYEDFQSKLWNRHYFKIHVVCEFNPYLLEDRDFDVYYQQSGRSGLKQES